MYDITFATENLFGETFDLQISSVPFILKFWGFPVLNIWSQASQGTSSALKALPCKT